jgi:hypothetical protein
MKILKSLAAVLICIFKNLSNTYRTVHTWLGLDRTLIRLEMRIRIRIHDTETKGKLLIFWPGFGQFHQRQRGEDPHEVLPEQHGFNQCRHQVAVFFIHFYTFFLFFLLL